MSNLTGLGVTLPGGPLSTSSALAALSGAVACNGEDGLGAGPDCFIVNGKGLELVQNEGFGWHLTGWMPDRRTGQRVYHWRGLPVYRSNYANSGATQTDIYAANLGRCGLELLHGVGSEDTCGFEWTEPERDVELGTVSKLYYGSFALVLWDTSALCKVSVSFI
jgi:hypothetical protein